MLYVLDEPSIGLHQRDNDKLIATLKNLRDLGNTVIVVEHDEDTMRSADYIVDVGPGAGVHGGEIVAAGSVKDICKAKRSITGDYLSGRKRIEVPQTRRTGNGNFLTVRGARENNLRNIDVKFPLGEFICVTGISGSGKSSLINEILYKTLACELNGARSRAGRCDGVEGLEFVDKVIGIDQQPIGRTPDVYKRQQCHQRRDRPSAPLGYGGAFRAAGRHYCGISIPVSYTHLDVYKRQTQQSPQ